MVTGVLRPNSTDTNQWFFGNHLNVDDVVLDPAAGDGSSWAADNSDNNQIIVMGFPTISGIGEVTNIQVKTRGRRLTTRPLPEVDVNMGGWQGEVNVSTMGNFPSWAWGTNNFAGSWSQSDLDGLQVLYRADTPGGSDLNQLDVVYVVVTYTLAPTGWGHKFNGIANANIAKINGILIANIAKVNGV